MNTRSARLALLGIAVFSLLGTLPLAMGAVDEPHGQSRMTQMIDTSGDDLAVAGRIWQNLVPKNGQAETVQGELLRAVEKLRWEAQTNGNINWDQGFQILLDYLEAVLGAEPKFPQADRDGIRADLERLRDYESPYVEDDLYDRLTTAVVRYARVHPMPVPHTRNPDLHR